MRLTKIIKPIGDDHAGDTFRELVMLWEETGLCKIDYAHTPYVWWNNVGDIVLYDRPTMEWYYQDIPYKFILFGNTVPDLPNSSAWIFWGRHPRLLDENKTDYYTWERRDIESIFVGKIENSVQQKNRTSHDWNSCIELFEMPLFGNYKYSQSEYLELLKRSRFGLCLRGYGPKCNREIELMCMGVVPIITPQVDLTYYRPPQENIHYIRAASPDEVKKKINSISRTQWEEMSMSCQKWYEENCSPEGSYLTTREIINNITHF